jgi:hypothetical protein
MQITLDLPDVFAVHLSCRVARQGMWVVAQFDAIDAADEEHMSSQLTNALGATLGSYELIPGHFSDEGAAINKKGELEELTAILKHIVVSITHMCCLRAQDTARLLGSLKSLPSYCANNIFYHLTVCILRCVLQLPQHSPTPSQ